MACFERDKARGDDDLYDQYSLRGQRRCTDIICLIIFFIFWAILIFLASFAFVVGNPLRLIYGTDSFGNICGTTNERFGDLSYSGLDMTDKPYLFYLNSYNISSSMKICVKMCPDEDLPDVGKLIVFRKKYNTSLCRYDYDYNLDAYESSLLGPTSPYNKITIESFKRRDEERGVGPCPKLPVLASKPIVNRCIPVNIVNLGKDLVYSIYAYINSFDTMKQVVSDLYASWREMLIMIGVAVIISFVIVFLIHFVAALVSYIILLAVSISLILVTGVMWWTFIDLKYNLDTTPYYSLLEEKVRNEQAFLILSIITTIITVVLLLLTMAISKRVKLVVALFQESGRCIRSMPLLFLQPIWTFITLFVFFVFWIAVLLALATADYPSKTDIKFDLPARRADVVAETVRFGQADVTAFTWIAYNNHSWVHYMWWYHIFALFWTCELILACQQMVIAGAVATWYFSRDRESLQCPIFKSTKKMFLYHLGSLALGSFLITIFKVPRVILTYIESKLKNSEHPVATCCLKCCSCFLWCLEKFLRYLNHNAYTIIAIDGSNFCSAAQTAFSTIVSNALRVATINSVGDFVLFLGKCCVMALTAFLSVLLMKTDPDLNFYAVPVVVVSIFAYFIAHCIISIYEMVIDTLFLCFCQDYSQNDGSPGKEYFAPPSLLAYLTESENTDTALSLLNRKPLEDIEERDENSTGL